MAKFRVAGGEAELKDSAVALYALASCWLIGAITSICSDKLSRLMNFELFGVHVKVVIMFPIAT